MKKTIEEKKTVERGEFNLDEAFVLWLNESKNHNRYLSGYTSDEKHSIKLIGFFNTDKKNPKEPDIRIYELGEDGKASKEEAAVLWSNVSASDKKYLSGSTNENEKLVGFYGKENEEKRPFIRAYYEK